MSGAASPSDDRFGREEAERRETVQSNLRALFRAEARYHADTGTYTDDIVALRGDRPGGFYPDPEVRIRIPEAHESGFSAVADWSPVECALFVGDAEPPRGYVAQAGVIGCR